MAYSRGLTLKDGTPVTLRLVALDDVERLLGFFAGLSEQSRYWFRPHGFDRDQAERIANDACGPQTFRLVAVFDDRIIGYAWFEPFQTWPDIPTVGLGVVDEFHDRGLGRAMMRALIERAREIGCAGLRLSVCKDNPRAQHLYTSLGYRIDGETDDGKQHTMRLLFEEG